MKLVYTVIFAVVMLAIVVFCLQNFGAVTVNFINLSITAPMALVSIALYLLGMVTGSTLFGLIRRYRKAQKPVH